MPMPTMKGPFTLALTLATLAGCAQVCHVETAPRTISHAQPCNALLDVGQRCLVQVDADCSASSTTLVVTQGQRYQVQVAPGQQWWDAGRCSSPPQGRPGNRLMNMVSVFRQDDAEWFTLMAAVVRDAQGRGRLGPGQPVDTRPVVEVQQTGVLALYPNDVPALYWNNKGRIVACIERLAPGAARLPEYQSGEEFCRARR